MSRSVYRPPLYRQILPWIYVAVFILAAPILIFYTAGYRYNLKKGVIERNGTLIVDSTPGGAKVFIDGADSGETTPITFQNITPGSHLIRISKPGYHDWEKTLDVRPERVTFANQLWLWKEDEPVLALPGNFRLVDGDPIGSTLALIADDAASTSLTFWVPGTQTTDRRVLRGLASSTAVTMRWREDGRALVVNGLDDDPAWLASLQSANRTAEALPPAFYRWDALTLDGIHGHSLTQVVPETNSYSQTALPSPTVDEENGYLLKSDTSTNALVLVERSFLARLYELPPGNWRLADLAHPFVLLKDGVHWLAVHPGASQNFGGQVDGDRPRWLANAASPQALLLNQGELWAWPLGQAATLLWRQSAPLVQSRWHRSGTTAFAADSNHLFAIGLDDRDGRLITPLADFDRIEDFAVLGKTLYIAGTKNNQSGIWTMDVE